MAGLLSFSRASALVWKCVTLALECKLVSYDENSELLLGEIVNVTADESVLDENGKLSVEKLAPVCYDSAGHGYYVMERRVGNAFSDGKTL